MFRSALFALLIAITLPQEAVGQEPPPVLDMHIHAIGQNRSMAGCLPFDPYPSWDPARPWAEALAPMRDSTACAEPWVTASSPEGALRHAVEVMERLNVYGMATGGPVGVARWVDGAPGRFLSGVGLWVGREGLEISPDSLRALQAAGRLDVLGEVTAQYQGIAPGDEAMEAYWDLAVELDVPVGYHMGIGFPGVRYLGGGFEARAGNPLALEEVLIRHPGLRVYVMHAGFPMLGEMLALMWAHPQVYVDTGAWISLLPRATAEDYLRRLVEAGMWKRILFGSDSDRFPQGIERGIRIIREAPFLTEEQKRDILYNNAARFLRLDEETIRRHHAGG
jgi:predicted TIM-barrel fold metal-dependent hydrolase